LSRETGERVQKLQNAFVLSLVRGQRTAKITRSAFFDHQRSKTENDGMLRSPCCRAEPQKLGDRWISKISFGKRKSTPLLNTFAYSATPEFCLLLRFRVLGGVFDQSRYLFGMGDVDRVAGSFHLHLVALRALSVHTLQIGVNGLIGLCHHVPTWL
jgi:hypothetical protein